MHDTPNKQHCTVYCLLTAAGLNDLKKMAAPVTGLLVIDREIELFRLQIVTELIKMHITAGRRLSIAAATVTAAAAAAAESVAVTSSDMTSSSPLPSSTSSSSFSSSNSVPLSNGKSEESVKTLRRGSQTSSTLDKKEEKKDGDKAKEKDKNEKDKDKEGGNEKRGSMDVDTIEQHLDSSLQAVEAIAGTAGTSIRSSSIRTSSVQIPFLQLPSRSFPHLCTSLPITSLHLPPLLSTSLPLSPPPSPSPPFLLYHGL